jgi:RNA polymerase sigma factor for flagellar operon FliA
MQSALKTAPITDAESAARRSTRDRLVKDHQPLVRRIAGAVRSSPVGANVPLDDLIAYGANGLLDAAERFDPERGVPFDVFCRYRVRGAIVDGIRRHHWLPRRTYKRLCAERIIADAKPANDVDDPGSAPLASSRAPGPVFGDVELRSLDAASLDDETAARWGGRWNGRRMYQPEVQPDDRLHIQARAAIEKLPYKERRLIELCYFEGKNLAEAGDALGMQRSWACRLHARAIAALRTALSS